MIVSTNFKYGEYTQSNTIGRTRYVNAEFTADAPPRLLNCCSGSVYLQ